MRVEKGFSPGATNTEGEGQQLFLDGFEKLSGEDFTMRFPKKQGTLAEMLGYGPENAITVKAIAELWNVDCRAVTKQVYAERRRGIPICSDTCGLYLPRDSTDVKLCVASMKHRSKETMDSAVALLGAWEMFMEAGVL